MSAQAASGVAMGWGGGGGGVCVCVSRNRGTHVLFWFCFFFFGGGGGSVKGTLSWLVRAYSGSQYSCGFLLWCTGGHLVKNRDVLIEKLDASALSDRTGDRVYGLGLRV